MQTVIRIIVLFWGLGSLLGFVICSGYQIQRRVSKGKMKAIRIYKRILGLISIGFSLMFLAGLVVWIWQPYWWRMIISGLVGTVIASALHNKISKVEEKKNDQV